MSNSFSCIPENQRIRTFLTATSSLSIASKYFQLEEGEDKDVSTTEIYLVDDGTVELFDTDGPLHISAHGTWCQNGETFEMTVRRVFLAGKEHTDVGQFQYEVIRKMTGQVTRVGGLASVQGGIYIQDDMLGDIACGYFTMIDTTEAKLGNDTTEAKLGKT